MLLAALLAVPSPASAWGFEAHKFIADRMIALLPARAAAALREAPRLHRRARDRSRPVAQRRLGRGAAESLPRSRSRSVRPVSVRRACRATIRPAVQKFGKDVHPRAGPAAVAHGGVLRPPAARVRIAEATAAARLRGRQHRALLRDPRALRVGRARAAARGRQLRRPADAAAGAALALGVRAVRAQSREAEDCAAVDQAGHAIRATSCSRRCSPAIAPRPTCSSPTRRPPKAASSMTMPTSRSLRAARCRRSSAG